MKAKSEAQRQSSAVMNQRLDPTDALDDFPTPPWATRALVRIVFGELGEDVGAAKVWEPAAGRGLMAAVLRDEGANVFASDVHRYADGATLDAVGSFVGDGLDVVATPDDGVHFVITNPPFALALEFAERGLEVAARGVALLCRSNWSEGVTRYERLFRDRPPAIVAQFVERVPMTAGGFWKDDQGERQAAHRGGFDPDASTATAYSWFVWVRGVRGRWADKFAPPQAFWIPPGQRERLTRPTDAERFAKQTTPPPTGFGPGQRADLSSIKGKSK